VDDNLTVIGIGPKKIGSGRVMSCCEWGGLDR